MEVAKIAREGTNQIIILPEQFHLSGSQVYIKKIGNVLILISQDNPWLSLFDSLDKFSDDFMDTREQPPIQSREELF
ncbi:type II toxin-antitoxin system VapB family antitoxin [Ancylothrix sp. C2]|uniref:antitoxin n=1 Tax=Ancylothrix sp. D3o TaxID=2953691 RepID=UPI0021BA9DA3|nr:type II toxin-antitoxin system VapB family antitoxin [Ancylothrix sp. D3o]MCT7952861.1 type II toxin-antitoxin system VapB family antitoxin [Ancylothrix sp. D3o]